MKRKIVGNILCIFTICLMSGCSWTSLKVKKEHITVEYGTAVSLEAEDYLDNNETILSKVKVSSNMNNEEDAEYPPVGEYTLKFTYKKQEAIVKISVVDTVKPIFIDFKDTVEIYQNNKVDFGNLYKAEDLSEVEISFDDSKVDYAVAGEYTATVTATDGSGNAETKSVAVKVLPVTVELDKTSASVYVGENVQLIATVNVPNAKAVFTSSDETIATVDDNGMVTGIKNGETTIVAELYGVKSECNVTVKTKPSKTNTSNGTTYSSSNGSSGETVYIYVGDLSELFGDSEQTPATPEISKEAFNLLNKERVALGLEPAVWDAECERIALIRAQELSELDSVNADNAHEGFFKFQKENMALGECVAWGYTSASRAVNGWMNSPGHRSTLMAEDGVYLAVAVCGTRWVAINSWSDQVEPW